MNIKFIFFFLSKNTPLICACAMGHIEIVQLLLNDPRTEFNSINIIGESALSRCCSLENENTLEIIELLLNHPEIDPSIPKDPYHVCKR